VKRRGLGEQGPWIGLDRVWLAGEESLIVILNGPARGPLIVTSRFGELLSMNLRYNKMILTEIVGFRYYITVLFGQFVSYISCLYDGTELI
jgi:hypothetical protein